MKSTLSTQKRKGRDTSPNYGQEGPEEKWKTTVGNRKKDAQKTGVVAKRRRKKTFSRIGGRTSSDGIVDTKKQKEGTLDLTHMCFAGPGKENKDKNASRGTIAQKREESIDA